MKTDVDTALKEIADWYVKNRREIIEPELEAILLKHCEDEAEIQNFVKFLETEPGQLRFKTLLRERKGSSSPELDNVEVYTSSVLPPDIAEATGLHRDPEVEFRYTTYYYGTDLGLFKRDLEKLLRERTGISMLVIDAYYIRREFKPGEIVRYKGERVRVEEHIGDRVSIWIPSRQEEVWVSPDSLERGGD